ncbi:MAG: DUF4922 domain-containing protein [Bacteroidales bacterium]|nr:DUF4922 domain-containing protein [Bacteroidales bacterium]MBP5373381.1 DUF4922 domain-containing protein [Bacteroidales bacterium]
MANDIDKFVHDQLSLWPVIAAKYRALKSARTRTMLLPGQLITIQSNPGRLPIFDHGCPLCEENYMEHQHTLPFEGRKGRKYNILVNRAPIFPNHLVITRDIHVPQTIWRRFPDMLDLAAAMENYIIFYNSPNAGTSVPDHAHFQACPKGYLPLERAADKYLKAVKDADGAVPVAMQGQLHFMDSVRDAQLFHYTGFVRGVFFLRSLTSKSMAKMFYRLLDCQTLESEKDEPLFNAFCWCAEGEYRALVCLRGATRSRHWNAEGEAHFAITPGAADMAGFVVVPEADDFDRLTPGIVQELYEDVCISPADEKRLLWRLVRTQPRIEAAIETAPEIRFEILSDGAGMQRVSYREGKIAYNGVLYDQLMFEAPTISTLFAEPSFRLWKNEEEQLFAGALIFRPFQGKVLAINQIGLEDYLLGVVSAEGRPGEDLMALSISLRSRILEQMQIRQTPHGGPALGGTPQLVTWLDTTSPERRSTTPRVWDVNADEPGLAYRGLTEASGEAVRLAVDETWGYSKDEAR